ASTIPSQTRRQDAVPCGCRRCRAAQIALFQGGFVDILIPDAIAGHWPASCDPQTGRFLMPSKDGPVIIKKYANRRLYNTGTSTYVTLEDLSEMVKRDEDFTVQDAKTGEDITH